MSLPCILRLWQFYTPLLGLFRLASHTIEVELLKKTANRQPVQKQLSYTSRATTGDMYADISFEDRQNRIIGLYQ